MDGGLILLVILIRCVFGAIAAAIASSKGRSVVGWFFGGLLLDIIGIIIVAVLPNLKEQERIRQHDAAERRRLREQLRQEKMKTEAFRRHATGRLDHHDRALGMDTRRPEGLPGGASPMLQPGVEGPVPPPPPPPQAAAEAQWYYASDGESHGPVPQSTLVWMVESGAVTLESLVWTEGQGDWTPASQIPAFRNAARS